LLSSYAEYQNINIIGDRLFPFIVTQSDLGGVISYVFIFGLIAAAFSSADSSLTSLTTIVSIDLWGVQKGKRGTKQRKVIHLLMTLILWVFIVIVYYLVKNESVIKQLLTLAGYTYGPLLGLFIIGIITKNKVRDNWVPIICLASPIITYFITTYLKVKLNYDVGFLVLAINGITSVILLIISGQGLPVNKGTSPSKSATKSR
jgi:Na+/proline symporter